uniref:Galectin n=1 Tax=Cyprinus carpio TaxID=7962 RepID=A0A8C1VG73_CYPCA
MANSQQQTFYKPSAITQITGGLKEGKTVIIIGRISANANTSNISLKDGTHPAASTALCISCENDQQRIVYKTFRNDSWDSDQPTSKSPLLQDQLFIIKILVTTQAYKKKSFLSDIHTSKINLRHRYGIAFHYLCRFEEDAVVRNTWRDGAWGVEEKSQDIPFKNGEFFEIKITCNVEQYGVSVNGQQVHTYKHRFTNLDDIDVVEVCGGLELFSLEAKDP